MIKICPICGKEFEGKKPQKYCSGECAYTARLEINRAGRKRRKKESVCKMCGASFISTRHLKLYCSDKCASEAANRKSPHRIVKQKESKKKRYKMNLLEPKKSKVMEQFKIEHHVFTPQAGDNYLSHQTRQIAKSMELYGKVSL